MAERWAGILAIGVLLACLIGQSAGQSDAAIQALFKWVEDNGGEVGTRRVEASCNSAHTHSHRATHAIMHGTPGGLGHHARALPPSPGGLAGHHARALAPPQKKSTGKQAA